MSEAILSRDELQLSQIAECVGVEAETVDIPWRSCGPLGVVGGAA